jgi:hypothetical protein
VRNFFELVETQKSAGAPDDGQLTLNGELTTALLGMVDAVRQMQGSIEVSVGEGKRDDTKLIATLTRLQQPPEAPACLSWLSGSSFRGE